MSCNPIWTFFSMVRNPIGIKLAKSFYAFK